MIHSLRFRLAVGAVVAIGLTLALVWVALSRLFTDYVVNHYVTEMTVLRIASPLPLLSTMAS